jgi:hypothetical protein
MYTISYSLQEVVNLSNEYDKDSINKLYEDINKRFEYFVKISKAFVVEAYIESEWRDSYDLYYSKATQYKCNSLLKRVHFVSTKIDSITGITEDNYVGYITLRPLPILQISRVRFSCIKDAFEEFNGTDIYCLSVDTRVNFPHKSIVYKSFPLYSQDGMVAICAHADLLMISKYMYKKFNFNNYKLKNIVKNNLLSSDSGRKIPSDGLNILQMLDILKVNNYNPISMRFKNSFYDNISMFEYIDSFLESALPVILAFKGHVVVVIGHMHNNEKHYIIADDSTYHIKESLQKKEAHVAIVSKKEMDTIFKQETVFAIAPTFDRFYLHYQHLRPIIDIQKIELKKRYLSKNIEVEIVSREILIESSELKQFLHSCGDIDYENIIMPHFVWYIEFYLNVSNSKNLSHYMLIDASSHKYDRKYSIIKNKKNLSINFAKQTMTNVKQISKLNKI